MKEETMVLNQPMSLEEYIAFEEKSEVRHEMIDQQLIAMPGTTFTHNNICQNLAFILRQLLRQKGFRVFMENVKVQITHARDYNYPDVVVANDPRDLDLENEYILKYPSVIFEVISKNSRMADSVDKFIRYQKIESLQNYILVDSKQANAEVRVKQPDGSWEAEVFSASDGKFPVPVLGVELDFSSVYDGVSFLR